MRVLAAVILFSLVVPSAVADRVDAPVAAGSYYVVAKGDTAAQTCLVKGVYIVTCAVPAAAGGELWRESNGSPGLQRTRTCTYDGGGTYTPPTCVPADMRVADTYTFVGPYTGPYY